MATFAQLGSISTSDEFQKRVAYAMGIAAAAIYSETFTTNAVTPAANAVLHFASVPGFIVAGNPAVDITASGVIPAGSTVLSTTATTVTISANVTGAGVGLGDKISFAVGDHVKRATYAVTVANGSYNLAQVALLLLGDATIAAEATVGVAGNTITDAHIQNAINAFWNLLAGA